MSDSAFVIDLKQELSPSEHASFQKKAREAGVSEKEHLLNICFAPAKKKEVTADE